VPKFVPFIKSQAPDVGRMLDLHPGVGIFSQRKMDANKTLYPNAKERQENKTRRAKYIAKV
jgi:hypothetical protein